MAGNGDSGISRGAVSRAMALHQMRNILAEEHFMSRDEEARIRKDIIKNFPECSTIDEFTQACLSAYGRVNNKGGTFGQRFKVGKFNQAIMDYLNANGIEVENNDIVISDFIIHKYINHGKASSGAVLPFEEYGKIVDALSSGSSLYIDKHPINANKTVFIYMRPYNDNRLLKLGIELNYKKMKPRANLLKHIGVVETVSVQGDPMFIPIKKA